MRILHYIEVEQEEGERANFGRVSSPQTQQAAGYQLHSHVHILDQFGQLRDH